MLSGIYAPLGTAICQEEEKTSREKVRKEKY